MGKVKLPAPWTSTATRSYVVLKQEAERNRCSGNMREADRCDGRAEMIRRRFLTGVKVK